MEDQGDPAERDHDLSVVLPSGLERTVTVHGSKPVIDLLVTLCAKYHLNPSDHTVEILSHNKNNVCFKPSSLIGLLEADTIVLKPKVSEDKARRPYTPEATVRLLVNYRKSHKTVVRVSPRVPLEDLVSAISQKCEFQPASTALLRDSLTQEPLDLMKSLNDLGIRELFAKDTAAAEVSFEVLHASETPKTDPPTVVDVFDTGCGEGQQLSRNEKKRGGNIGFLSLFRRKKDKDGRVYMPVSQDLQEAPSVRASTSGLCSADPSTPCTTKKRPAPRPPITASRSVPDNISGLRVTEPQSSANTTLRRTKRKAPLPPCAGSHASLPADTEGSAGISNSDRTWELRPQGDSADSSRTGSPLPSSSSTSSSSTISSSSTQLLPPPQDDGCDSGPSSLPEPQRAGKVFSQGHSVLSQIINSSLSNGKLPNRRHGDASFSKPHGDEGDEDLSLTHEPLLGPRCLIGGQGGIPPHPELWGDALQRKGMTTFKVVPAKKHRLYEVDQGLVVPDDRISTTRWDPEDGESRADGDPPGSPEPRTSSPAAGGPVADGGAQTSLSADSDGVQGEVDVPQAEVASPAPQDSGSQEGGAEVDRPGPEPETRAAQVEEDQVVRDTEAKVSVHEAVVVKDKGVQKEEIQGEGDYDEVPDEDDEHFPPPPPPVAYDDQDGVPDERSTLLRSSSALPPPPPPSSSTQTPGGPGTPTKDASSPLKRVSTAPSRFAQAVALAVQRTRSAQVQGRGYGSLFRSRSGANPVPSWLPQSSVNSGSCPG
ncbi:cordon-bleu protein-like 1 isoform X2 [Gadus morhua]|uniref:cordon-bleu protein-like 1 isoform X2 n=1 Tax=Gadus morhua TaxID=8049 RepID=UPI0011B770D3|nr:cordon-bleu protein-like 1 isoform X2 [Gadus morhua]